MARYPLLAVAVLAAALASPAAAATHSSSVHVFYGGGFDDVEGGYATKDGRMLNLLLDHTVDWALGDNYLSVEMASGDFAGDGSVGYSIYAEWIARLSFAKTTGVSLAAGPLADLLVVGEVNRGAGYSALLGGVGIDLALPGFSYAYLHLLARDDNFNAASYQISTAWSLPFRLAGVPWQLDGWFDLYGTDAYDTNVLGQPMLLADLGAVAGLEEGQVLFGSALYFRHARERDTLAPQALFKWIF